MKTLFYVLPGLAVIALAYWAYSENYATQAALRDVERLTGQIGAERRTLSVLRAEWAYLNRPDRLRDLADLNYERLELGPLTPAHFAGPEQVPYPAPEILPVDDAMIVDSTGALP